MRRVAIAALGAVLVLGGTSAPAEARPMHSGKWKVCTTQAGQHVWHCKRRAAFLGQQWVVAR